MCGQNQTLVTELVILGFGNLHQLKSIIFFICFLTYVAILAGNILIINLIITSPRFHSPMYFFLCNLSLCEVIFTTNIMPNMLYIIWAGGGYMTLNSCITQLYFHASWISTECLLLTIMAFDRYLAICNPLRYSSVMNVKTHTHMAVWAWLSTFIAMSILITAICNLRFCGSHTIDHLFCDLDPLLQLSSTKSFVVEVEVMLYATVFSLLPFLLIILSYVAIFCTIIRIPSETGRQKTFSTCSSHLASVCTYFGTIFIIYLGPSEQQFKETNKILSFFYMVLTPLLNPIIYSLRNQVVKDCFAAHINFFFPMEKTIGTTALAPATIC